MFGLRAGAHRDAPCYGWAEEFGFTSLAPTFGRGAMVVCRRPYDFTGAVSEPPLRQGVAHTAFWVCGLEIPGLEIPI